MSFVDPDSEDALERNTIRLFEELGWTFANCYHEICGENSTLGRETTEQVVLEWRLKTALAKLNPDVPPLALDLALDELTKDRSVLSPVRANEEVHKLLKDGIRVTYRTSDDNEAAETVKIIDGEHPDNNDFFLASQFWISGEYGRKRADLIGFVNGIPLLFIELKASHKHLENAYKLNLSDRCNSQRIIPHFRLVCGHGNLNLLMLCGTGPKPSDLIIVRLDEKSDHRE